MVQMGTSWLAPAAAAWAALAVCWIALAWPEPRGRSWHIVLACAPFAGFALAAFGGEPFAPLARLWLLMGGAILAVIAVAWLIGEAIRNHGVMDIFYPLTALAAAALGIGIVGADAWRLLLVGLIAVWAVRLAVQTYGHNVASEREPYASWRRRFGAKWRIWSIFQIHLLQGVTVWIWCFALAAAFSAPAPQSWTPAIAGAVVWAAGFALQTTADRQLAAFKRDPANRGKLLDTGVWSFVRHPNYLGEAVMWWGLFCFALAHPWGVLTVVSPLFATWFMGYASAAPYKERHMAKSRPEAWAAYCARTPRFLPWPRPKSPA